MCKVAHNNSSRHSLTMEKTLKAAPVEEAITLGKWFFIRQICQARKEQE